MRCVLTAATIALASSLATAQDVSLDYGLADAVGVGEANRLAERMMQGVKSCVPGIETVGVQDAAHNIHIENPTDFNRVVVGFVARH
jgi:hypothetical protein